MRHTPGTLQSGKAPFPTTQWSVVAPCRGRDPADSRDARRALDQLCRDYWPPLYSFVRRRGHGSADAKDFVQGFFAFLLENQSYARADRAKGKFRTFLISSLQNYLADERDRRDRFKRGGDYQFVWIDQETDAVERQYTLDRAANPGTEAESAFERRWALTVVARALGELRARCGQDATSARICAALEPFLTGGVNLPDQRAVAAELGISPESLRNQLSRLRARFREALREEVRRTVANEEDLTQEMRYLLQVLLAAP